MPWASLEQRREYEKRPGRKESRAVRQKIYYDKNREKIIARALAYQTKNMVRVRDNRLRRELGITEDDFQADILKSNGKCPICREVPKTFYADHNHKTGEFRGAICTRCNTGLGMFRDNIEIMKMAIEYIEIRGGKND